MLGGRVGQERADKEYAGTHHGTAQRVCSCRQTRFPHPTPRGGWFPARRNDMAPRNGNSSRHDQYTTHGVLAAANTTGPAGLGSGRLMAKARRRGDLPTVTNKQHTEGTCQVGPCSRTPPLEKVDDRRRGRRLYLVRVESVCALLCSPLRLLCTEGQLVCPAVTAGS